MFRDYEKNYCLSSLREGNSLLILGTRRTGKSSLLKEVARLLHKEKYHTIEVDCQDNRNPSELFLEILKKLPKDTINKLTDHLRALKSVPANIIDAFNIESIKGFGVDLKFDKQVRDYWIPISKSIEKIILNNDGKIILFLDELPFFFENMLDNKNKGNYSELEVKQILATLRSWRNEGIQMALCGSLNINYFLESKSISHKLLAGLNSIEINPFADDEARQLLKALAKGRGIKWITDEITNKIIKLIQDNVPFFLQTFFSYLLLEKDCSVEKLQEIFDLRVYPHLVKNFLYQFDERFAKYPREEQLQAEVILDYIATHDVASFDEIQKKDETLELKIFLKLVSDEFFKPVRTNKYSFSLNIVKNWWKQKRGING